MQVNAVANHRPQAEQPPTIRFWPERDPRCSEDQQGTFHERNKQRIDVE